MKKILSIAAIFAASIAFTQAEDTKPAAEKPAAPAKTEAKGDAFSKKDTNNDGSISKEEFTAGAKDAAKAAERFAKLDKDNDGKLTKEEFAGAHTGGGKKK